MPPSFNIPYGFYTPSKGIKIFGVPFDTSSFTSSLLKDFLLKDVQNVNLFSTMGDI
jgi:hypothetical protein